MRAKVILPSTLYGDLLIMTVADSRAEEEFIPAYGHVRESNEDNNVSAGLTLRIPVPIVPAGPAGHVVTGPRRSSDETWRMGVNRLTIEHKSESSGDEPYFVVIGFRAQLFRAGSATAFRNRHLRELADDRESGDVTIPSWMGSVEFPHVQRLTTDEFNSGTMPEVVGAVVIAMESDRTPWGDITGIFDRAQAA